MNKSINERENKAGSDSSPQEPRAAAWKTPSPTNQSLSQRVKRCNRYGTSSITPKRPCLVRSQSSGATGINRDTALSHDRSQENSEKDSKALSSEGFPLTPLSLDIANSESDATITHQSSTTSNDTAVKSCTAQSLEELRQRRTELQQMITSKEQILHNLNLVKLHRAKNDIETLKSLTTKWQLVVQKAVIELHESISEPRPSLTEFVKHLQLDHSLIGFNVDDESFD